jgi:hypothetical protein
MTEREMFERSFQRPKNYFKLTPRHQWNIDDNLGILDWKGEDLSDEDKLRFNTYFGLLPRKNKRLRVHKDYPFFDNDGVTFMTDNGPAYAMIIYSNDLCAWLLVYFTDESFTTPRFNEDGTNVSDFVYEVGLTELEKIKI